MVQNYSNYQHDLYNYQQLTIEFEFEMLAKIVKQEHSQ